MTEHTPQVGNYYCLVVLNKEYKTNMIVEVKFIEDSAIIFKMILGENKCFTYNGKLISKNNRGVLDIKYFTEGLERRYYNTYTTYLGSNLNEDIIKALYA